MSTATQTSPEPIEFDQYDRTAPKGKGTYTVTLNVAASRLTTIQKEAEKAFGEMLLSVNKVERATSRSARLSEAQGMIEDAKGVVEELKDELQEWFDALPENFQSGDKGQDLESAIGSLQDIEATLEVEFDVEFPGMY
jgi:hypothetical protein